MTAPALRVHRRRAEELSDADILELFDFGAGEGEILDRLEAAIRAGDPAKEQIEQEWIAALDEAKNV